MKKTFKLFLSLACFLLVTFCRLNSADFKSEDFVAGIALKDFGYPGWAEKYTPSTLDALRNSAARWVSIHYFNSYTSTTTPTIGSSWKSDGYKSNQEKLDEYKYVIQQAKKRGYKVCLISSLFFGEMLGGLSSEEEVSLNESLYSIHTSTWYENWFSSYRERLLELAKLADEGGADMLALGWNITYVTEDNRDGYNTTEKWKEIISELKNKYPNLKLILPETTNGYSNNFLKNMKFLDKLDYVSVHLTMDGLAGFSGKKYIDNVSEIKSTFETIFSTLNFAGYYKDLGKKTILFTTVTSSTRCFEGVWFEEMEKQPNIERDFNAQANVYQAMFEVLSSTDWAGGTFPWGYWWKDDFYKDEDGNDSYSFDKGPSIRKKPAEDVVYDFYSITQKTLSLNATSHHEILLSNKKGITKIIIPEKTFNQNVVLTISTLSVSGLSLKSAKGEIKLTNVAIEMKTDLGLQPEKNVVIEIYYTDEDIQEFVSQESKLVIARLNEETNFWEELPSTIETDYNHIVATTTHLSKFAIILPSFVSLEEAKVMIYPNPFYPKKNSNVTIKYYPTEADVYIYNLAGELIAELDYNKNTGQSFWDGKNKYGKTVASGIYFLVIKTDKKTVKGKIAVIK